MTASQDSDLVAEAIAAGAREARTRVETIANAIAIEAHEALPPLESRHSARRLQRINEATLLAVHRFLDAVDGAPHRDRGLEGHFRDIGSRLAGRNGDLSQFGAAIQAATSQCWRMITHFDVASELDASVHAQLGDALIGFLDHLVECTRVGFDQQKQLRDRDITRNRSRVAADLLRGKAPVDRTEQLPESLMVAVAELAESATIDFVSLSQRAHFLTTRGRLVMLFDPDDEASVLELMKTDDISHIALTWPVSVQHVPAAHRWAQRALHLVVAAHEVGVTWL